MIELALAVAVLADTNPITTPPWWETRASASAEYFTDRLQPWQWHSLSLERRADRLSYGFSAHGSRRFGLWDEAFAAELTSLLWHGAYANARAAIGPEARVIARRDVSAELYQSLGRGWEVVPGIRYMAFASSTVPIYGLAVGKYVGDWYLRGRATVATQSGRTGTGVSGTLRRYGGSSSEFVELAAGVGDEVEVITAGAPPTIRRVSFASVRAQRLLTRAMGMTAGASMSRDDLLPSRFGVSVSLFVRR